MAEIFIKPNTDARGKPLKVRLPNKPNAFLPEKGARVEKTPYWLRRLRDGSVVDPAAEKVKAAEAKKQEAAKTTTKE